MQNCGDWEEYDRNNLPICDDDTFRFDATHIEETGDKKAIEYTGISGLAILAQLPSIDFPRSFPPDSMHLFFENVIPVMVRHYRGVFFKKDAIEMEGSRTTGSRNQGHPRGAGRLGSGRPAANSQSRATQQAATGTNSGMRRGGPSSGEQRKLKFKQTSDPWNVGPKAWQRIGQDQEVSNPQASNGLAAYFGIKLPAAVARKSAESPLLTIYRACSQQAN